MNGDNIKKLKHLFIIINKIIRSIKLTIKKLLIFLYK